MLILLADEHIPATSIRILRDAGHDVISVSDEFPTFRDIEILRIATEQGRTVVTCDSDFGELVFKHGVECPGGVIYFRINRFKSDELANIILHRLDKFKTVFEGRFTVLTRTNIRQKQL